MTEPERAAENPNTPLPEETPGLTPGGAVQDDDTPPSAGQMSGTSAGEQRHTPNQGPVSGNRTPMIVTLVVIAVIVLAVAALVIASFVS